MNVDYDLYEGETASGSRPPHATRAGRWSTTAARSVTAPGHGRFVARAATRAAAVRGMTPGGRRRPRPGRPARARRAPAAASTRAPSGWRGRRTGRSRASGCWASSPSSTASASTATRRATSGPSCPGDGSAEGFVIVGSHIDAVPSGGWLDGALGVMAALGGPARARGGRRAAAGHRPAGRLGRRGGRALRPQPRRLLGRRRHARPRRRARPARRRAARGCRTRWRRSASTSTARGARTRAPGRRAAPTSSCTSSRARCCSTAGGSASAVSGTFGDERYLVTFSGQSAHAGSTPMRLRRDTLAAAATAALEIREVGIRHGGV